LLATSPPLPKKMKLFALFQVSTTFSPSWISCRSVGRVSALPRVNRRRIASGSAVRSHVVARIPRLNGLG
jgi:hypothetical protein